VRGSLRVPGDKSISHRALLVSAIADGSTEIHGYLDAADPNATLSALRALGVRIERDGTVLQVHGVGLHGLRAPTAPLDMGNAGTAMRLIAGLLAGQAFASELVGDASLSRRPMRRIAEPLISMGAGVTTTDAGTAPINIHGEQPLRGGLAFSVTSAQVQGAILLAGLYADGPTTVHADAPLRAHTEVMLRRFGVELRRDDASLTLVPPNALISPGVVEIPRDISSAAFHLVLAALNPDAEITLRGVGADPTRDGVLRLLARMGMAVARSDDGAVGGEHSATLTARSTPLHGATLDGPDVTVAMDEFPILAIAAAGATGPSAVVGAPELRVKESDRISAMAQGLATLGIVVEEQPDGLVIQGGRLSGGRVDACGDHRVAMAFAVAATVAKGPIRIDGCGNIGTSYPGFVDDLRALGITVEVHES